RSRYRKERLLDLHVRERGLEVIDIALKLRLPGVFDGTDADGLGGRRNRLLGIELGVEIGKFAAVGSALERIGRFLLDWPALKTRKAFQRVLCPADRFAELSVAHDVDAGICLFSHDIGDGVGEAILVGPLVVGLAALPGTQEFLQRLWADQTADVRA